MLCCRLVINWLFSVKVCDLQERSVLRRVWPALHSHLIHRQQCQLLTLQLHHHLCWVFLSVVMIGLRLQPPTYIHTPLVCSGTWYICTALYFAYSFCLSLRCDATRHGLLPSATQCGYWSSSVWWPQQPLGAFLVIVSRMMVASALQLVMVKGTEVGKGDLI